MALTLPQDEVIRPAFGEFPEIAQTVSHRDTSRMLISASILSEKPGVFKGKGKEKRHGLLRAAYNLWN
jgi:hypothetical protein